MSKEKTISWTEAVGGVQTWFEVEPPADLDAMRRLLKTCMNRVRRKGIDPADFLLAFAQLWRESDFENACLMALEVVEGE